MPGRFFLTTPAADISAILDLGAVPEQPKRFNIAPGEEVLALSDQGFGMMRWGMIMSGRVNARKRPVMETIVNARSETLFGKPAFEGVSRAVVPADGWYEWTGTKGRKKPWRIRALDGNLLWFAAIYDVWQGPGGITVPQVATVTCEPNADVRDIHHRMGVLLRLEQVEGWLAGVEIPMDPAPDGSLKVEEAGGVDWNGG